MKMKNEGKTWEELAKEILAKKEREKVRLRVYRERLREESPEVYKKLKKRDAKRKQKSRRKTSCKETRGKEAARKREAYQTKQKIAKPVVILDFETDPFDPDEEVDIQPFYVHLYSKQLGIDIGFWNNNPTLVVNQAVAFLHTITEPCIIYAHNGGRFDFKFLTFAGHIYGPVMFKGTGYMKATLGIHELRDSFHILPVPLKKIQKDEIDYSKMLASQREKHREEIIRYCRMDCVYLHRAVLQFHDLYGVKLTIGQAARATQLAMYKGRLKNISPKMDEGLRPFMRGGDVDCPRGAGTFHGVIRYYDVNSMYPFVMKTYQHPVGNVYMWHNGGLTGCTRFLRLKCPSVGLFIIHDELMKENHKPKDGIIREFEISIHEYRMAEKLGLLPEHEITQCVDNVDAMDFSEWVDVYYDLRLIAKQRGNVYEEMCHKSLLVNGFGKFAQDPERFKEHYVTNSAFDKPTSKDKRLWQLRVSEPDGWSLWERETLMKRYFNVGTGASITGAARAELMEKLAMAGEHALYHDTDSCITINYEFPADMVSQSELGKLKLERVDEWIAVAGKKIYCLSDYARSKGVKANVEQIKRIAEGEVLKFRNLAPTFDKLGAQHYITRTIRRTTGAK
jgi:hypothetical protein